ncbi:MAG: Tn7 transposase TnsA N-terminal domain-containing protein [Pseudohongiella sp.]|nr:Tn7 transposase TnsA N-terminal domain-containing protein [Pseudohongiella sp.]
MRQPARKLKKSSVKNIVRFPSTKSNLGETILVESILESKYCLHLEFNENVTRYYPQPQTFRITDDLGHVTYTPDFEVHYRDGTQGYVEVKPLRYATSEEFTQLFARFEKTLAETGKKFHVATEIEIYEQPLLDNYEKLYQFRKRHSIDRRRLHQCAEGISGPITLSALIAQFKSHISLREIYTWLAHGFLVFDISSESLTMDTEVTLNV